MYNGDSSRHKVTLFQIYFFFHKRFSPLTVTSAPINGSIIFTPSIRFPPDARYAQELDRRWRPRLRSHISRMIAVGSRRGWLTERPEISLSLSRAFCYLPFKYLVFGFLAPLCLSVLLPPPSTPKPKLPIGRNIIPSYLSLTWPGRGVHRHAFRSIRKTRPADRRTVAHSHGLPLPWHLVSDRLDLGIARERACTRNRRSACVRLRLSRARRPHTALSPRTINLRLALG